MEHVQGPECSVSSCSAAREAETRGHAGISPFCPRPQRKQRERGKRGCHLPPERWHAAHSGGRGVCQQAWSGAQGKEQSGTNLSKISCSARWGQGEKESSQLKSPQMKSQTQAGARQTRSPGSTALLLTQRNHSSPQHWVRFLQLQHLALPDSENEWEWLKAIHPPQLARGSVCCTRGTGWPGDKELEKGTGASRQSPLPLCCARKRCESRRPQVQLDCLAHGKYMGELRRVEGLRPTKNQL